MNRIFAILMALPVVAWLLCIAGVAVLAMVFDCNINEGFVQTCMVLGRDTGDLAYTLGLVAAWGPLMFGPVVVGTGILWAVVALIAAIRRRSR